MIGVYNQFNLENFIRLPKEPPPLVTYPIEVDFTVDTKPLIDNQKSDVEQRVYTLIDQNKDRVTKNSNLIEKIQKIQKVEEASLSEESDQERNRTVVRYFSDMNTLEIASQGLCRRCKKVQQAIQQPGHFEKWCIEECPVEVQSCRYCLSKDHYHLKCPLSLCFKCNGFGHLARECMSSGQKCHRCNKRGHLSRDCHLICLDDKEIFHSDRSQLKLLKCLNCMQIGHFNCSKTHYQWCDRIYQAEAREKEVKYTRPKEIIHHIRINVDEEAEEEKVPKAKHTGQKSSGNPKMNQGQKSEQQKWQQGNNRQKGSNSRQKEKEKEKEKSEKYTKSQAKNHFQEQPKPNKIDAAKHHNHRKESLEDQQSVYSMWSSLSPEQKRKNNNKRRKKLQKQRQKGEMLGHSRN